MKKQSKSAPAPLDKHRFEAGLQCHKRLWLDAHDPAPEVENEARKIMSRTGDELRDLARTAFPKGVAVTGKNAEAAAAETTRLLEQGEPVLFDATFVADGVVAVCDVLVVHKDQKADLFEIKAGTKVKHRYVSDLALQATVLEKCGLELQRAFLLHINAAYVHKAGEPFPPMQLIRSADVTAKVQKLRGAVQSRLRQFRQVLDEGSAPALPMGTYCRTPFPCPHFARCRAESPGHPLCELPELSRQQELALHKDGIEDVLAIADDRADLTFRQRRTLACLRSQKRIVEPFVKEELSGSGKPWHFVAIAAYTDPLPRFDKQKPWQTTPYAWAAVTVHEDGRVEQAAHVHLDRDDPRPSFARTLARHLEVGGTLLCWDDEAVREVRTLLDGLPDEKAHVRALLGQAHLDMMKLFESGVFDPQLTDYRDLRRAAAALLGDQSGADVPMLDDDERLPALDKARQPRVRATTRDKLAAEFEAGLRWQAERLRQLFEAFAGITAPAPAPKPKAQKPRAAKPLPKLPE
ncbi:MAG: DUF2779 domain-containing protein [Planctomycetes bacterium]|nr:DUF2779 domain-containing protein [Planctomycetota bacterium]